MDDHDRPENPSTSGETPGDPPSSDSADRARRREAIDEARRAAAEAASKAAAAARVVGKELRESTADALDDVREVAREVGERARAATAEVMGRAREGAAPSGATRPDHAPSAAAPAGDSAGGVPVTGGDAPATAGPPANGAQEGAPRQPPEPGPAVWETAPAADGSSTGFDPNLAAALSYVFAPLTGPLFFIIERQSRFVRFHAMQAILLAAASIVTMVVFLFLIWLPLLGRFMFSMAGLGFIIVWLLVMWKALNYEAYRLPFIGDIARSQVEPRAPQS